MTTSLSELPHRELERSSEALTWAVLTPQGWGVRLGAYMAYGLLMVGLAAAILLTCRNKVELRAYYEEARLVENLQTLHLAISTVLFGCATWAAFRARDPYRWLYSVVALGSLWAVNRESDGIWETYKLDAIYDALKVIIGVPAVVIGVVHFRSCWQGWLRSATRAPFVLLYIAVGGYLMAQVVGHGVEWITGSKTPKRIVQETIELLVGTFFVFSAVEVFLWVRWAGRGAASKEPARSGQR